MIGYPYQYNDFLSEQEAMKRRVELFDKGLVLFVFWGIWSLMPTAGFASDIPKLPDPNGVCPAPGTVGAGAAPVLAPIMGFCKCTSPKTKTAILLLGIGSICYTAMCTDDKKLIALCSAVAASAATHLSK